MDEEVNVLQNQLLDELVWFDRFCRDNGIRYYMIGGTMLGAARHKGFIPWDDDVDVGVPRTDYDRLETLMRSQTGRYVFETVDCCNDDYTPLFGKLYDTTTTLVENTRKKLKRGIYLDVYPLDGYGQNDNDYRRLVSRLKFIRSFYFTRVFGIREGRKWYKNLLVRIAHLIPDRFINEKRIRQKIDKISRQYDFDSSKWVGAVTAEDNRYLREVFGTPSEYVFENTKLLGLERYDDYLTSTYGDWRTPPPEDKRYCESHDYCYLDLNKSYLDG